MTARGHDVTPSGRGKAAVYLTLAGVALFTLAAVLIAYHVKRDVALDLGQLGDAPFLSGFYADEADLDYRYRWTTGHSQVTFEGSGYARPDSLVLRAQAVQPVTMSVSLDGLSLGSHVVTGELKDYTYQVPPNSPEGTQLLPPLGVTIETPTFRPPGDARDLGAKIARVELHQESEGMNLPPLSMLFWPLVLALGVYAALSSVGKLAALAASLLAALLVGVALLTDPLYAAVYLPPVAVALAIGGLVVGQRGRLRSWPQAVDALGQHRLAAVLMASAMLLYAALSLWTIPQVAWIGHADYAENAVIARNLVQGRGFTVDYVAQFYRDHEGISHPADTWPLLQPLLIAPFFLAFGPETWAAKLPNLFVMLGLAWAVFAVGSRLWDPRVGLFAGLLTLAHPYFFNSVLYPINDLGFTLIFFVLAWLVWRQLSPYWRLEGGEQAGPLEGEVRPAPARNSRSLLLTGALAGLLVWSKPSGAVLLLGLALWAAWTWRRYHRPALGTWHSALGTAPWRALLITGGAFALVLLPLVIRNLLAFGVPFFTTESYDAWILRYWPYYEWENIYRVYVGGELPHPRWIVGGKFGYQNVIDAVVTNFRWVWDKGVLDRPGSGDYVLGLLPLAGAVLGLATLTRRAGNLFGMVGLSIGLYALFVLVYWHFEGRYFQVAVPWLYMLVAWGVFWMWDHVRRTLREGVDRRWGLLILPLSVAALLWPHVSVVWEQAQGDVRPYGFVDTMRWLAANSTEGDVVMTRDPWELNWYTRRQAVMIPFEDLPTIERIARQYGVTMLQLGGPVDRVDVASCPDDPDSGRPFPTGSRPALGRLYCGFEMPGYRLVYKQGGGTIYRLTNP